MKSKKAKRKRNKKRTVKLKRNHWTHIGKGTYVNYDADPDYGLTTGPCRF